VSTGVLAAIFLGMMILRPEGLLGRWELDELLVRGKRMLHTRRASHGPAEREPAQKGGRGEGT
jgi:hypothetical protein